METRQPKWELIANLGDVNPLDYGGYFIYRDTIGAYPEEAEKLGVSDEFEEWAGYRLTLDRLKQVQDGDNVYLVPFKFDETWPHPVSAYDEWFHDKLSSVAESAGQTVQELRDAFCSDDPRIRAFAYEAIGDH